MQVGGGVQGPLVFCARGCFVSRGGFCVQVGGGVQTPHFCRGTKASGQAAVLPVELQLLHWLCVLLCMHQSIALCVG